MLFVGWSVTSGHRSSTRLPGWAHSRVVDILRNQYDGSVGYNPGSQIVQIAGVSVLSDLDHVMKERMRAKRYVRYMDDIRIVSDDIWFLYECLAMMSGHLAGIGFELNERKTVVRPLSSKVPFCGFDFVVRRSNVLLFLRPESVKRMRRRVGHLAMLEHGGLRPAGTSRQSYMDWRAHAAKGCSKRLLDKNDCWFIGLERTFLC